MKEVGEIEDVAASQGMLPLLATTRLGRSKEEGFPESQRER